MAGRRNGFYGQAGGAGYHDQNGTTWIAQSITVQRGLLNICWSGFQLTPKQIHSTLIPWFDTHLPQVVSDTAGRVLPVNDYIPCSLDLSKNPELARDPQVLTSLLMTLNNYGITPTVLKLFMMNINDQFAQVLEDFMKDIMPKNLPIKELHLSHNQLTNEGAWRILETAFFCGAYPTGVKPERKPPLWLRLEKNPVDNSLLMQRATEIGLKIGSKERPNELCTVNMPHFFITEAGKSVSPVRTVAPVASKAAALPNSSAQHPKPVFSSSLQHLQSNNSSKGAARSSVTAKGSATSASTTKGGGAKFGNPKAAGKGTQSAPKASLPASAAPSPHGKGQGTLTPAGSTAVFPKTAPSQTKATPTSAKLSAAYGTMNDASNTGSGPSTAKARSSLKLEVAATHGQNYESTGSIVPLRKLPNKPKVVEGKNNPPSHARAQFNSTSTPGAKKTEQHESSNGKRNAKSKMTPGSNKATPSAASSKTPLVLTPASPNTRMLRHIPGALPTFGALPPRNHSNNNNNAQCKATNGPNTAESHQPNAYQPKAYQSHEKVPCTKYQISSPEAGSGGVWNQAQSSSHGGNAKAFWSPVSNPTTHSAAPVVGASWHLNQNNNNNNTTSFASSSGNPPLYGTPSSNNTDQPGPSYSRSKHSLHAKAVPVPPTHASCTSAGGGCKHNLSSSSPTRTNNVGNHPGSSGGINNNNVFPQHKSASSSTKAPPYLVKANVPKAGQQQLQQHQQQHTPPDSTNSEGYSFGQEGKFSNFKYTPLSIPQVAKEAAAAPMGNVPSVLLNAAANAKMHNNAAVVKKTSSTQKKKNEVNGKIRGAAIPKTPGGESPASAAADSGVSAEARKLSISYVMRKKIMAVREKNSCMVGAPLTQLIRDSPPRSPSLIVCDDEDAQSVPDVEAIEEDIDDDRDMDLRVPRENSSPRPSPTPEAHDPYGNPDVVNISDDDDDDNDDVVALKGSSRAPPHEVLDDTYPEVLDDDVQVMCEGEDMYAMCVDDGGEEEDVDGRDAGAQLGAGLDDYPEVLDGDEALLLDAYGVELGEEEAVIIAEEASGEEAQQQQGVGENNDAYGGDEATTPAFQDMYPEVVEIFDDEVETVEDQAKEEQVIKRRRSAGNEARSSGEAGSSVEVGSGISGQMGSMANEDANVVKETPAGRDPLQEVLEYKLPDKEDMLKEVLNYRIEPKRKKAKEDTSMKEVLEYNVAGGKTDFPTADEDNDAYYRELLGVGDTTPTPRARKKSHSPKRTRPASEDAARKGAKTANTTKSGPGGVENDGGVPNLFALWTADIEAKNGKATNSSSSGGAAAPSTASSSKAKIVEAGSGNPREKAATPQPTAAGSQLKTKVLGSCKPNPAPSVGGGMKTAFQDNGAIGSSSSSSSSTNPNGAARASKKLPLPAAAPAQPKDPRREHNQQQPAAKRLKPNEQNQTSASAKGSVGIKPTVPVKAEVVDCEGGDAKLPSEAFHLQLLGL